MLRRCGHVTEVRDLAGGYPFLVAEPGSPSARLSLRDAPPLASCFKWNGPETTGVNMVLNPRFLPGTPDGSDGVNCHLANHAVVLQASAALRQLLEQKQASSLDACSIKRATESWTWVQAMFDPHP